jgi:membrane fusion protein, multidrug efflux system
MAVRAPKSLVVLGVVLLAAAVVGAVKIMAAGGTGARHAPPPAPVGVATAKPYLFVDKISAIGTAGSNESVAITAKMTETVRKVSFNDGDKVEAGTILVELENDEDAAALQAAHAALSEATNDFQRATDLLKKGSGTRQQLDQARTKRDAAQGQVDTIEARLADRLIKAPFAGVLGLRQVSEGALLKPGDVITTLDDVSTIKLDFTVPETYLAALATGLDIEATTPAYPGRNFDGKIIAIDTRVDPVTRAVTVRAVIPNADFALRPGILMTVEVIRAKTSALAVPDRALVANANEVFVYRVNDGVAGKVSVTTGHRQNNMVELKTGVKPGDLIVTDGTNRIRPGQPVTIVEKDGASVAPPPGRPQA